jgi:hypothetical protein
MRGTEDAAGVDQGVLSLAESLKNLVGKGRMGLLYNQFRDILHTYFEKSDYLSAFIFDRRRVDVSNMAARKRNRALGTSFLNILRTSPREKGLAEYWWTSKRLQDAFVDSTYSLAQNDPAIRGLLQSILKVDSPDDLRKFLTIFMLLNDLQKREEKKGALPTSTPPATGAPPSVPVTKEDEDLARLRQTAELLGIDDVSLTAMLQEVRSKHEMAPDVKALLDELTQSLNDILAQGGAYTSVSVTDPSQQIFRQKQLYDEMSSSSSSSSPASTASTSTSSSSSSSTSTEMEMSLERQIQDTEKRLKYLNELRKIRGPESQ